MKYIFFDVDTNGVLSNDGVPRPYLDIILRYCQFSKIRVFLSGTTENVQRFYDAVPDSPDYIIDSFTKDGEIPHYPNLVISCDNDYLQKWPGLLLPSYDPARSNEFADISLAGRLLDTIRDRVVLNKDAPEKQPVKRTETTPTPTKHQDPSSWGFNF